MDKHNSLRGAGMVLLAAVIWGTTGTAQTLAPAGFSSYWVGALRLVVATVFFAGWAAFLPGTAAAGTSHGSAEASKKPALLLTLGAGAFMAVFNLAFFAGISKAGIATGTAVAIGSGPIWAGLLQALTTGRMPPAGWWAGTLCAVAGGALMVLGQGGTATAAGTGVALCLLAGLCYAGYALCSKSLVRVASTTWATLGVFGAAALLALPAAFVISGAPSSAPAGWWVVLYLGVVATGIAYMLFARALRHIAGATGVTLALGEPVTAFALAVLVVGERPRAIAFLGLALVLAGLAIVVWREVRGAASEETATPASGGRAVAG